MNGFSSVVDEIEWNAYWLQWQIKVTRMLFFFFILMKTYDYHIGMIDSVIIITYLKTRVQPSAGQITI